MKGGFNFVRAGNSMRFYIGKNGSFHWICSFGSTVAGKELQL